MEEIGPQNNIKPFFRPNKLAVEYMISPRRRGRVFAMPSDVSYSIQNVWEHQWNHGIPNFIYVNLILALEESGEGSPLPNMWVEGSSSCFGVRG